MKITSFVRVTLGDKGTRIVFGRKATEAKGHRTVTQFGCFGDGIAEEAVEELCKLLTPTVWEGQEDDVFLSGKVTLDYEVEGEPEEYEVPEDFVPDGLKSIEVLTTPVRIVGCSEAADDKFTTLARKRAKAVKPTVLKSKD